MGLVTALPHQAFVFFPRPNCLFLYTLYISSMQYFSAFLSCLCSCVLISIPPHGATSPATLALHVLLCLLRPDWWTDSCLDSLSSVSLFTSCYCFVCHFQSFLFIYVPPPCDSCLCPPPFAFLPSSLRRHIFSVFPLLWCILPKQHFPRKHRNYLTWHLAWIFLFRRWESCRLPAVHCDRNVMLWPPKWPSYGYRNGCQVP